MTADQIIEAARRAGVNLIADGGRLVAVPASALTDDLRTRIRAHKTEILARVALPPDVDRRLQRMVRDGALDPDDADLIRARYHAYPHEWRLVLDACEAAAEERRRTTTTAPARRAT